MRLLPRRAEFLRVVKVTIDGGLIVGAYCWVFLLGFDPLVPSREVAFLHQALPWVIGIQIILYFGFHLNQTIWRYVGLWDVLKIAEVSSAGMILGLVSVLYLGCSGFPRLFFVVYALLEVSLLSGARIARRIIHGLQITGERKRVLIFGAGDAGEMIVRDMKHNPYYGYRPVGFIDDDPAKLGGRIHGVRVLGSRKELRPVMEKCAPEEVLIAMPRMPSRTIRDIVKCLDEYRVPIKILPSLRDVINGAVSVSKIRNVSLEDLLSRAPMGVEDQRVPRFLEGRRVMVTGAGGSIGSELCLQLMESNVRTLVMYERHENSLYLAENRIRGEVGLDRIETVVGDVTDVTRIEETIRKYGVDVIFHAAAHKHVPMMELNPCEAVKNNVRGTRLVLEAAMRNPVERFVLVSTDKAVNPSSVMGASKRVAELLVQSAARRTGCEAGTVRFGNVLGSNGSVIPKFLKQINAGGPVTVTHPAMRRFFMLIPEAVQLILHATAMMEPGAVYVLEMGEQINIAEMARQLIRLCGLVPDSDVKIEFTGLRAGEKLFEELVGEGESVESSPASSILKIRSTERVDVEEFARDLYELESAAAANDRAATCSLLERIVPTFRPKGVSLSEKEHRLGETVFSGRDWTLTVGDVAGRRAATGQAIRR